MRPLSVSTALFDGYPIERAFAEIANAGIAFVEPAFIAGYVDFDEESFGEFAAAALASEMAEAGVSAFAVSAHHDMGAEGARLATARRLRFAARLGATCLITNATTRAQRQNFLRNLDAVLPVCEETGVVLALENPGHGDNSLIASASDGVDLVEEIGSRFVRLNYDFGNVFTYSRERVCPEAEFEAAIPAIVHAHVKDVLATPDGWTFTAIGDGSIDYAAIWRRLAKLAPDLPVGLELPLRLKRPDRADPLRAPEPLPLATLRQALDRSLAFLRSLEPAPAVARAL
jgi:sugar phosphate isomerase/epimerase